MSDEYFSEDFLNFVIRNDGRNFKQGSKMNEACGIVTPEAFWMEINELNKQIEKLSFRITALEKQYAFRHNKRGSRFGNGDANS